MAHHAEHAQSTGAVVPPGGFPISQIAIVVKDIDEALERYNRALGWGPWNVYEHKPPALHDTYLHGKPTHFTMIGAETHVGPIVVELLQPDEGPSIYKEWLDAHGEGLHHIAVMRPTPAESDATEHHFAHLSSAFHVSPFEEAAVVSVDGFGDFLECSLGGLEF